MLFGKLQVNNLYPENAEYGKCIAEIFFSKMFLHTCLWVCHFEIWVWLGCVILLTANEESSFFWIDIISHWFDNKITINHVHFLSLLINCTIVLLYCTIEVYT